MLSCCRSGLLALTLVMGCVLVAMDADAQTINRIEHQNWVSDVSLERLQDNSILTEYYGETTANPITGIAFRIGFIPRFGCAPLITFKVGKDAELLTEEQLQGDSLSVSIDGTRLPFPTLTDEDGDHYSVYLNDTLQRRITTKIRIEVGNVMLLKASAAGDVKFSLLGSRDAVSIANQNCRRHDPSIQDNFPVSASSKAQ